MNSRGHLENTARFVSQGHSVVEMCPAIVPCYRHTLYWLECATSQNFQSKSILSSLLPLHRSEFHPFGMALIVCRQSRKVDCPKKSLFVPGSTNQEMHNAGLGSDSY